jgi:hypothetical protein
VFRQAEYWLSQDVLQPEVTEGLGYDGQFLESGAL